MRKNFYIVILLLVPAIILSPVKLFGVAALFLLNSIFIGFYSVFEPRFMLNPHGLDSAKFLKQKAGFFNKMILLINLPLLIVNSIFHPEVIVINMVFLLAFLLLASNIVFLKYSNYHPNGSMPLSADLLILFTSIFIPYLLPIGIFLYFSNLKKASLHLSNYIDDHS